MRTREKKIFTRLIIGGGVLSVLVLLGIEIFSVFKKMGASLRGTSFTNSLTKQDSSLITDDAIKSITRIEAYHYQNKESLTVAFIENDYTLIIHKLTVDKSFSPKKDIHINNDQSKGSPGYVYSLIEIAGPGEIHYLSGSAKPSSLIYMSIEDQRFHTDIQSDSLAGFSFQLKSSSLKYSKDSPVAFVVRKKEGLFMNDHSMPASVLFWKNKSGVYLFYLIRSNKRQNSPPLNLQEMIRN